MILLPYYVLRLRRSTSRRSHVVQIHSSTCIRSAHELIVQGLMGEGERALGDLLRGARHLDHLAFLILLLLLQLLLVISRREDSLNLLVELFVGRLLRVLRRGRGEVDLLNGA